MQQITNHVYVESNFQGCNTGFVDTRQGIVVIDTPMVPTEAKNYKNLIDEFGKVVYVINSEPHPDHVSGNCWFGGTVIAHEGTKQAFDNMDPREFINLLKEIAPESLPLDSEFKYRPPEITFSQRLTLFSGECTLKLINFPGHTPYQLAIYLPEDRVIFTSDNVVREMPIFNALSMPDLWLDSLKQLQQMDVEVVVPGHGEVCGKTYLEEMFNVVQHWIESVRSAINNGWTLEETLEKITLADLYQAFKMDELLKAKKRRSLANLYKILKDQADVHSG